MHSARQIGRGGDVIEKAYLGWFGGFVLGVGVSLVFALAVITEPVTPPLRTYELAIPRPSIQMGEKRVVAIEGLLKDGRQLYAYRLLGVFDGDTVVLAQASLVLAANQSIHEPVGVVRIDVPEVMLPDGQVFEYSEDSTE